MGQVGSEFFKFFRQQDPVRYNDTGNELNEEQKAAIEETRRKRDAEAKATRLVSSFRLMSGALIDGDFKGLKDSTEARERVADALGWPVGTVQLLTMNGGTMIFEGDPLPKEGEDEIMAVVDSQAVKAYIGDFMKELPLMDPPSPLMFAVLQAKTDAVRVLLLGGHDPSEVDDQRGGKTPLHAVADNPSLHSAEICRLLLGAKADAGVGNDAGLTPLHVAALANSQEVVRALLNGGADRNALAIPKYNRSQAGQTPTRMAVASGNLELIEVFTDHVSRTEKARFVPAASTAVAVGV